MIETVGAIIFRGRWAITPYVGQLLRESRLYFLH